MMSKKEQMELRLMGLILIQEMACEIMYNPLFRFEDCIIRTNQLGTNSYKVKFVYCSIIKKVKDVQFRTN